MASSTPGDTGRLAHFLDPIATDDQLPTLERITNSSTHIDEYALPVDEQETKRLGIQHHLFHLTLDGKLHRAPLDPKQIHDVLDIGTGTGSWAIDFAKLHPQTRVIGSDISSLDRPQSYVRDDLANLSFVLANAEEEWRFENKFDYIHGRMLMLCFKDVKRVFEQAFKSLQPGGWFEMQDLQSVLKSDDGSVEGTAVQAMFHRWIEIGKKRGIPFGTEPPNYKRYMEEVGFVDVHEEILAWPTGPWMEDRRMKEIGSWWRMDQIQVHKAFYKKSAAFGDARENDQAELDAMIKDVMNPDIHGYTPLYLVWGKKPEK